MKPIEPRLSQSNPGTLRTLTTNRNGTRITDPINLDHSFVKELEINPQVSQLQRAVFQLRLEKDLELFGIKDKGEERASAVVISSDGFALTAAHAIPDSVKPGDVISFRVKFSPFPNTYLASVYHPVSNTDPDTLIVPVKVLHISRSLREDFAILKLPSNENEPYDFARVIEDRPGKQEDVYSIGYPRGNKQLSLGEVLEPSFSTAKVKEQLDKARGLDWVVRSIACAATGSDDDKQIVSTNHMYPGSSGGGLFRANKDIVGVTVKTHNLPKGFLLDGYARGLDLKPVKYPLSALCNSSPMDRIVQEFASHKVNITKMREGEPASNHIWGS